MRNSLVRQAKYEWHLMIDARLILVNNDFLIRYLSCGVRVGEDDILDEFDRLIKPLSKKVNAKILNKDDHLKATKYKNPAEMLKATIEDIAKEGAHINDESKKVIFGKNGCIVIIDNKGICETCFKPKKGIDYYESNAITKYDSIKNKGIKKWLEKLLLKF
jgi:hypothetical protein